MNNANRRGVAAANLEPLIEARRKTLKRKLESALL